MAEQTLSDRIAALASEDPVFVGKSRVLDVTEGATEALLDALDSTVLSSRLTFQSAASRLVLDVAGRRLVQIETASEDVKIPEAILGQPISMDSAEALEQLARAIYSFTGAATELKVEAEPLRATARGDTVSVAALRDALGATAARKESPMDQMLAQAGDKILAVLRLEGNTVAQTKGAIAQIETLKAAMTGQLETFLSQRATSCPSHSEPSLTLCTDSISPGVGLGLAVIAEERTLFAFETVATAEIYRIWKRAL